MKDKKLRQLMACTSAGALLMSGLGAVCPSETGAQEVLPRPEQPFKGKIDRFYKDSTPDWSPAAPVLPPANAPNIVVIVLDDIGFGQLGSYGGSIQTPNMDRLAADGLRYNSFHTAALSSPSRAALLTGRNHHSVAMSTISEVGTGFPSSYGAIPKSSATVAEVLKQNGYNTFALGKWHLAPYWSYTAAGPFDRWPLGMGFERYYGFLSGETDQWAPGLWYDNHRIPTPTRPGYHLSEDLVDKSIEFIHDQQQANTGRPFFLYLAFGAAHAPLHAPKAYIEKYKGKFDQGWDRERELVLERQKKLGIVPANTVLPERNPGVKPWAELSVDEKRLFARLQETYAGFVDHADAQIGRLLTTLSDMKLMDNTLIVVVSDNGASQESGPNGVTNTDRYRNYLPMSVAEMLKEYDDIGGRKTDPGYPIGWSMAGNTPFKRWKQDVHRGGTADPFIVHWPKGIQDKGAIRTQFHHLTDIVPTLLEVTGIPMPSSVNGVAQKPLEGVSMAYTFANAKAPTRKTAQYFEMFGSRAIWSQGWMATVWHKKGDDIDRDQWELYNLDEDFSQSNNLAAKHPDKLREMQDLWWTEAGKFGVLPIDDRRYERLADTTRPKASLPKESYTFYPGTSPIPVVAAPRVLNVSHRITAEVEIPAKGAEGILLCLGTEFGGWSLFVKDGKLVYAHNYLKIQEFKIKSTTDVPKGKATLAYEFTKTGENVGTGRLFINGKLAGELAGIKTAANDYAAAAEGLQVGRGWATPVSHDYEGSFQFTGKLESVTITILK
ncbi:MAG: arylsulfatase [Nitrospiraceae bacterium]|nr:arylsulfatase [Nitrospiraceae bacterium]